MPHFTCNYSSWWNTQDQQISQTLSKNINFRAENSLQHRQEAEHLGLQFQDEGSPSTQSSSQSIHDLNGAGSTTCQDLCVSSSQPVHAQIYQKRVDEQVKSTFELSNPEFSINTSEMDTNQSTISFAAYTDPYYNSLFNGYGPQAIIQSQMLGMAPTRIPLPPDLAQDGPIYVNARQYRGILRRRQIRAKLEAQNKLVKNRKPYLHESRHLHAVKRVRGTGGRFLGKQQQQSVDTVQTNGSKCTRTFSHNTINMHNHKEDHHTSSTVATNAATATSTTSIGYTGGGGTHPPDNNGVSSRMTLGGGFSGNERWRTTAGTGSSQ